MTMAQFIYKAGQFRRSDPVKTLISLDYDGTASTNVPFWTAFARSAKSVGYAVMIVTMRDYEEATLIEPELAHAVDAIVCTDRKAKKDFCQKLGIHPQIWIDDMPWAVYLDVGYKPASPVSPLVPDYGSDISALLKDTK